MVFRISKISILAALAALSLALSQALAAESFLFLEGLPGESTSRRHAGWIEIESYSFGVAKSTNTPPIVAPLSISKKLDKASPLLFLRAADGRMIKNGILEIYRSSTEEVRVLQLKLGNLRVTDVSQAGATGDIPRDALALQFDKISWIFTEIRGDGRALRDISANWNLATQTGSGGIVENDIDNDGMPDEYERLYNLKVDRPDADEDSDNDGMTNIEEFRAGTVPNSPNSTFRVLGSRSAGGAASLSWAPTAGKTYRLMGAPSPDQPFEFIRFLTEAEIAAGQLDLTANGVFQFFTLQVD
jgi:type VI secretion system Hcp family effector